MLKKASINYNKKPLIKMLFSDLPELRMSLVVQDDPLFIVSGRVQKS